MPWPLTLQALKMYAPGILKPVRLQPCHTSLLGLQDDDADALYTTPIQLIQVSWGYAVMPCYESQPAQLGTAELSQSSLTCRRWTLSSHILMVSGALAVAALKRRMTGQCRRCSLPSTNCAGMCIAGCAQHSRGDDQTQISSSQTPHAILEVLALGAIEGHTLPDPSVPRCLCIPALTSER